MADPFLCGLRQTLDRNAHAECDKRVNFHAGANNGLFMEKCTLGHPRLQPTLPASMKFRTALTTVAQLAAPAVYTDAESAAVRGCFLHQPAETAAWALPHRWTWHTCRTANAVAHRVRACELEFRGAASQSIPALE
jgi:hypothetical protein